MSLAWEPGDHPRGYHGQFTSAGEISFARVPDVGDAVSRHPVHGAGRVSRVEPTGSRVTVRHADGALGTYHYHLATPAERNTALTSAHNDLHRAARRNGVLGMLIGPRGFSGDAQAVELTGTAAGAAKDQRIAAGSAGGGQFGSGQGGKQPDAHQKHVAHMQHEGKVQKTRAGLLAQAKSDRAKAHQLEQQRNVALKALASASGKTSKGQAGSRTASNATTKSTAPAATSANTTSTASSPRSGRSTNRTPQGVAALKAQIGQLNKEISQLLAQAAQDTAQAAKLR